MKQEPVGYTQGAMTMTSVGIYTIYDGIQLKCSREGEIEEICRSTAHNFNFSIWESYTSTNQEQQHTEYNYSNNNIVETKPVVCQH